MQESDKHISVPGGCGRGLARRRAFMDAAEQLFLEKGFERTSLNDIVERSGGARSTLYEQFGSKEGLLMAMIENSTQRVWKAITFEAVQPSLSAEGLAELGLRFLRAALADDAISVYRIVVAEGHRLPDIAQTFYNAGPKVIVERLAEWFALAMLRSQSEAVMPYEMARIFMGAMMGDLHVRLTIGLAPSWSDGDLEKHVKMAARIFLNADCSTKVLRKSIRLKP